MRNESKLGATICDDKWQRRWHYLLQAILLVAALSLGFFRSTRGLIAIAIGLLSLLPFCYARRRLVAFLCYGSWRGGIAPGFGVLALILLAAIVDLVLVAQLVGARSDLGIRFLQRGWISWSGPVWYSGHVLFLICLAFYRFLCRVQKLVGSKEQDKDPVDIERRQFLQRASVFGAGLPFAASFSGARLSYDFRVEQRMVEVRNWPRQLDGLRAAHLSDIHVGGEMDADRLMRVVELTNEQQPDIVFHTGDFLTHRRGDFDLPLYRALEKIEAPLGQWACLGNHDYDNVQRFVTKLRDAGVTALRNQLVSLRALGQPFEVAGLDYYFERWQWSEIYRELIPAWGEKTSVPRILLNHDPTAFDALPDDCADLVLSGHTHGGQIGIQLDSDRAITLVGLAGWPDQGLFQRGSMRMFVTRCVGYYGYPMRIGIPPEISILTLQGEGRESSASRNCLVAQQS